MPLRPTSTIHLTGRKKVVYHAKQILVGGCNGGSGRGSLVRHRMGLADHAPVEARVLRHPAIHLVCISAGRHEAAASSGLVAVDGHALLGANRMIAGASSPA